MAVSFFHIVQDGFGFDISRFSEATASVVFVAIVAVVLDVSDCGIEGADQTSHAGTAEGL